MDLWNIYFCHNTFVLCFCHRIKIRLRYLFLYSVRLLAKMFHCAIALGKFVQIKVGAVGESPSRATGLISIFFPSRSRFYSALFLLTTLKYFSKMNKVSIESLTIVSNGMVYAAVGAGAGALIGGPVGIAIGGAIGSAIGTTASASSSIWMSLVSSLSPLLLPFLQKYILKHIL